MASSASSICAHLRYAQRPACVESHLSCEWCCEMQRHRHTTVADVNADVDVTDISCCGGAYGKKTPSSECCSESESTHGYYYASVGSHLRPAMVYVWCMCLEH